MAWTHPKITVSEARKWEREVVKRYVLICSDYDEPSRLYRSLEFDVLNLRYRVRLERLNALKATRRVVASFIHRDLKEAVCTFNDLAGAATDRRSAKIRDRLA